MPRHARTLLAGIAAVALLAMAPARADDAPVAEQIVNLMNKVWGAHPGIRSNHAKGLVVEGTFKPSAEGALLSKTALFRGPPTPVTVRFSDATGIPAIPDGQPLANPHGMAVKFHLEGGGEMDIVANSLKVFPVATAQDFVDLFVAISESGPDAPRPTKIEKFVAAHPSVAKAGVGVETPVSFARETYNGINAFVFVSADGKRQPFRFTIEPEGGAEHLDKEQAALKAPDFLMTELPQRIASAPVVFHLKARLAEPGDPVDDATQPWPDGRRTVDLGTITLAKAVPDSAAAEKSLLFLPLNLADGIEPSDDPLIQVRNDAYAVSFGRRS